MAALSRIANGTHRQIQIIPGDTVVFSSSPIPGNTISVNRTINMLFRAGAEVIHGKLSNIHTSGHGGQEEQKLMLRLIKPKFFMPIHGEYRMQRMHSKLAIDCGVSAENCFIMDNGEVFALSQDKAQVAGKIPLVTFILMEVGLEILAILYYVTVESYRKKVLVVVVVSINMKEFKILQGQILFLEDLFI